RLINWSLPWVKGGRGGSRGDAGETHPASRQRAAGEALLVHRFFAYLHVDLGQLLVRARRRRARHQALRRGGLRERDHGADRLGASGRRGDAVEAVGDAAARRGAVLARVPQAPERGLGLLGGAAQPLERRAVHLPAGYAARAAADLVAVEHHVVAALPRGI